MAQLITVRLSRNDGCAWGFRLQGGKDFGTPLVIQKVNGGSPAEKAGLIAGDAVVKVNTTDVFNLRHKDAQDVIVRAGQSFEMTVQRGGSTWKPAVTPVGNLPRSQPLANNVSPVTKTSLAAKNQSYTPIGAAHNLSPKGFSSAPHMNGDGPKLVNKQYNSPIGIYSEDSIAETLSAQAEVLSTGALGVNFKKNEKTYNADKSEVLKMLQEVEKEPRSPEPAPECNSGVVNSPVTIPGIAGLRHVQAPENRSVPSTPTVAPGNPQLPPGQNICADCERLIVGVFVRIKDKNLHVECFKCATCGSSLKNVGYYNINNKLYCDIHAKLAARSNPPAPNMVPVTIPPGGKAPLGTISAALASHSLPSPSPLSPSGNQVAAPFQNSKQDNLEIRTTPNSILKKEDAVANLMSALTMASQKEVKENGTNTEPCYLSEKIIPVNNNHINNNGSSITTDQQYPSATIKYMPYRPMTGSSLSGPRPFSSVQPSTPTHAPVAPPLSSTLPRSASSNTMPENANEEISNNTNGKSPEQEILMQPISSEMYIPMADYNSTPKFNSIDLRVPIEIVKDKNNSPDQEVFQINASRSYDNSPVQFDGNLRNFVRTQLDNGIPQINFNNNNKNSVLTEQSILVKSGDSLDGKTNSTTSSVVTEKNSVNGSNYSDLGLANGEHPVCNVCNKEIKRGPFITALGKIWCPEHFVCTTPTCKRPLQDMGFVEERGQLYCEYCFEQYLAPICAKCNSKIKGDCLNAIGKHFHPECFTCAYCSKLFGNSPFFLEDGLPYCEADWNELFTTKCFACGFPVEAGDRWVEALNNNYHSQCFNCTMCKKNLEGQSFYAKGGRPFCKNHAR